MGNFRCNIAACDGIYRDLNSQVCYDFIFDKCRACCRIMRRYACFDSVADYDFIGKKQKRLSRNLCVLR